MTTTTNIGANETGNVETRSLDNAPEHVETDLASKNLPVEMINCTQNNGHVETNTPPEETSAEPPPPQSRNNNSVAATASTSMTDSITATKNKDEIGAEQNAADSSSEAEMDTSMHNNSAKPHVTYLVLCSNYNVDCNSKYLN